MGAEMRNVIPLPRRPPAGWSARLEVDLFAVELNWVSDFALIGSQMRGGIFAAGDLRALFQSGVEVEARFEILVASGGFEGRREFLPSCRAMPSSRLAEAAMADAPQAVEPRQFVEFVMRAMARRRSCR